MTDHKCDELCALADQAPFPPIPADGVRTVLEKVIASVEAEPYAVLFKDEPDV